MRNNRNLNRGTPDLAFGDLPTGEEVRNLTPNDPKLGNFKPKYFLLQLSLDSTDHFELLLTNIAQYCHI